MVSFKDVADVRAIEAEMPYAARDLPKTMYEALSQTAAAHGTRPAITFQLLSEPNSKAMSLTWAGLLARVTQCANLFRALGIGERDVVAFILPNSLETAVTLLAGTVAGIVNPINPLLDPDHISAILRETGAKVVVTLRAFPKTDLPQRVAEALRHAPQVHTVLEVDLTRSMGGIKQYIVPLVRPKFTPAHNAKVLDFNAECDAMPAEALQFTDLAEDRVGAYFHTGGTTGMPKVAQHKISGMIYNGWLGEQLLFREADVVMCPLPLFHVLAAYPVLMSMVASGAHVHFPTPAGYRGEGVFDNLWKLVARWKVTYLITVPTALSALMQRPINADISTLRGAFSGSAPLPIELYSRFEKATGVAVVEGYGLTETTCLVSFNPPYGEKRIGSVGLPFPYCDVRILAGDGAVGLRDCAVDEVGEICVASPGVFTDQTYTDADKNKGLYAFGTHLRTGDLGRLDAQGYLYITGRAKDLIIRGGHNIDPALIEEALMRHPAVAFVGAIGQPDARAGEVPCAYLELVKGGEASPEDLLAFAENQIHERAALPKHIEVVPELPKTAVGKVLKNELRKRAILRVYDGALAGAGLAVRVVEVVEDKKRGLVARLAVAPEAGERPGDDQLRAVLGQFAQGWDWAETRASDAGAPQK
jgi:fatty-acyl-CoA synthase